MGAIDDQIRPLLVDGKIDVAVELILREHGPSIFRMIVAVLQDDSAAEDVFQDFSIELLGSLESFRGDSSVYTWAYTIARRAVSHHIRRPNREYRLGTKQQRELAAKWTRTATADWRKTESRDRFRDALANMEPDDRTLVMLRIGEQMAWRDIARILSDPDEDTSDAGLEKASARHRKRFERIKNRLKELLAERS